MPQTATKPKAATAATNGKGAARHADDWKPELFEIPLERIQAGANVRSPNALDVQELAASIRAQGVLSPIRVEEAGPGEDGTVRYALVYGQRRLAAAKVAGLTHIPAIVDAHNRTGADLVVTQLVENLQREDLNPLEEARAYRQLLDAGVTQKQLAERLGIAPSSIAHALRLLKLAEPIQAQIAAGDLTASHAKAIANLPNAEQAELGRRIVEHKLSAHQVEEEVRLAQRRATQEDRARDEARQLADAAEKALVKKKAGKEATRLQVYDSNLAAELKRRGWTLVDRTLYYGQPKGCDCVAFTVSRQYMGDRQDSVTLQAQCVSQAHVDAARKADEAERAKRTETVRKEHEAKAAARQAETDAIVAHFDGGRWGTTDDWRCILAALWAEDPWGFDAVLERNIPADKVDDWEADDDRTWTLASQLDQKALGREFGIWLAENIEGPARVKLLELTKRSAKVKADG